MASIVIIEDLTPNALVPAKAYLVEGARQNTDPIFIVINTGGLFYTKSFMSVIDSSDETQVYSVPNVASGVVVGKILAAESGLISGPVDTGDITGWSSDLGAIPNFAGAGTVGFVPDPISATGKVLTDNGTWQALYNPFKGQYVSLVALQTAHPTANVGDYANVDAGVGQEVTRYVWDADDSNWVEQLGLSSLLTDAQVKTQYENNTNTNAFTDVEKTKLGNQSGTNSGDEVQATEVLAGKAKLVTTAIIQTEATTNDTDIVTAQKWWQGIARFVQLAWTWTLKQTFTVAPRLSSTTASQILEVDASKDIVSVAKGTAHNKDFGNGTGAVIEGNGGNVRLNLHGYTTGTNSYAVAFTPTVTALVEGTVYYISVQATNTSPIVSINPDGLGAKQVKKQGGSNPTIGDLRIGTTYAMIYIGGQFRLVGIIENLFTSTQKGIVPASGGVATNVLKANGTWGAVQTLHTSLTGTPTNPIASGIWLTTTMVGAVSNRTVEILVTATINNITVGVRPVGSSLVRTVIIGNRRPVTMLVQTNVSGQVQLFSSAIVGSSFQVIGII